MHTSPSRPGSEGLHATARPSASGADRDVVAEAALSPVSVPVALMVLADPTRNLPLNEWARVLAPRCQIAHHIVEMVGGLTSEGQDARLVGETLADRWRVVRLLGRGGMSTVYEVRHRNGARAAIKVLNAELARNPRTRERFLREGRITNAVDHPNAVRVLDDLETRDGKLVLVMELLEGATLRERCQASGGRLELPEVLEIADRLLHVLSAAHAKGIVHRDIKPENVFLTRDGELKVLDFGIAAARDEVRQEASLTQSGATLGTPAFMAPEQARGRHAQTDARTDIWAVGATLFFCLTGRHVHEDASTANEALIFSATQRVPSLSMLRPELAADVALVVDRALALSPADRWPSAEAMREALASAARRPAGPQRAATSASIPWTAETLGDRSEARDPSRAWWRSVTWQVAVLPILCVVSAGVASVPRWPSLEGRSHPAPSFPAWPDTSESVLEASPVAAARPEASADPRSGGGPPPKSTAAPSIARRKPAPDRVVRVQPAPASATDAIPEAILDRRK
jgi:serine/threonine protein kinase